MLKEMRFMKQTLTCGKSIFILIIYACIIIKGTMAQQYECNFQGPVLKIDFGTDLQKKDANLSSLKNYSKRNGDCPDDGYYSFASYSKNCFNNNFCKKSCKLFATLFALYGLYK